MKTEIFHYISLLIAYPPAPSILFLKGDYILRFSDFLIFDLCISYVNCRFDKILLLITAHENFLSKILETIVARHVDIHLVLDL